MKKYILILLIFTGFLNAQTYQNPTYGTITEKTNLEDNSATKVKVQDANGKSGWILKSTFAVDANAVHKTGNETIGGGKTIENTTFTRTNYFNFINNFNSGSNNRTVDNVPLSTVNNFQGIGFHFNNILTGWGAYGFNQSSGILLGLDSKTGSTGDLIQFSKNEVTKARIDHNSYAYFPYAEFSSPNTASPQVRVTNGSLPSVIEFPKTGFTMKGTVGALGSYEMNMSTNMDYTSNPGVHRLYDNSKNATWLAIGDFGWQMQFAAADVSAGDVWNNQGQPRLLYQYQDGRMRINTTAPLSTPGTTLGDSMFGVRRAAGKASISGETDLVIEGNKTYGTAGEVYINPSVQTGGSGVGIGTTSLFTAANFNFLTINGLNGSGIAFSSNNVLSSRFGVNTAETYLIETRALPMAFYTNGTKKMQIHSSGGVSINNTTDPGTGNLSVTGNITATSYSGGAALTGTPTAPTASAGTNTTQIATTAFVTTAGASFITTTTNQAGLTGEKAFNTGSGKQVTILDTNASTTAALTVTNTTSTQNAIYASTPSNGVAIVLNAPSGVTGSKYISALDNGIEKFSVLQSGAINGVKTYTALVTQTGTSAPTVTVLGLNTVGTIVPTFVSTGRYRFTLTGAFTASKTAVFVSPNYATNGVIMNHERQSADAIDIYTLANNLLANGLMTNAVLEIRVYP